MAEIVLAESLADKVFGKVGESDQFGIAPQVAEAHSNAMSIAENAIRRSESVLSAIESFIKGLNAEDKDEIDEFNPGSPPGSSINVTPPAFEFKESRAINPPELPVLKELGALELERPPVFETKVPELANITTPKPFSGTAPTHRMNWIDPHPVAPPAEQPPKSPVLDKITLPDLPDLNLAFFTDPVPVNHEELTGVRFDPDAITPPNRVLPSYDFSALESLHVRTRTLVTEIFDGKRSRVFTLFPRVHDAALQTALDREAGNDLNIEAIILNGAAARGFATPPGSVRGALRRSREAREARNSGTIRELMVQEIGREREDIRWVSELVFSTTKELLSHETALFELSVTFQKHILDAGVTFFGYQRDRFMAKLAEHEAARKDAREKIEMRLLGLEQFKMQLEAARTQGAVQEMALKQYTAEIQGVQALYERYRHQLEGEKTKLSMNQVMLEAFAKEVEAYESQVKAKALEFEAYARQWEGEGIKMEAFAKSAQAYKSRVEAWAETVRASSSAQEVEIKRQGLQTDLFRTNVELFKVAVDQENERLRNEVSVFEAKVKQFTSHVTAKVDAARLNQDQFKIDTSIAEKKVDFSLQKVRLATDQAHQKSQLILSINQHNAQIYSQLAASALSTVNFSGSISASDSKSVNISLGANASSNLSRSNSESTSTMSSSSTSNSTSMTETHYYDETR